MNGVLNQNIWNDSAKFLDWIDLAFQLVAIIGYVSHPVLCNLVGLVLEGLYTKLVGSFRIGKQWAVLCILEQSFGFCVGYMEQPHYLFNGDICYNRIDMEALNGNSKGKQLLSWLARLIIRQETDWYIKILHTDCFLWNKIPVIGSSYHEDLYINLRRGIVLTSVCNVCYSLRMQR